MSSTGYPLQRNSDAIPGGAPSARSALERVSHIATAGFVVLFTTFVAAVVGFTVFGAQHGDQIYPGVAVAGADVGGMTRSEARAAIGQRLADYEQTPLTLTADGETVTMSLQELGVTYDVGGSVDKAFAFGRDGSLWNRSISWSRSMLDGESLHPVAVINADTFGTAMDRIAPEVHVAPRNAFVDLSGTTDPVLVDDVDGIMIDREATRSSILQRARSLDSAAVVVNLVPQPAAVQTADIEAGVPNAAQAVSDAFVLSSAEGEWAVEPNVLRELVSVDASGELQVDRDGVAQRIGDVATAIDRPAQDAGITVDETGAFVIIPQVDAAVVDVEASTDAMVETLIAGERRADLVVERAEPEIVDGMAEEWADRADELVGDGVMLTWSGDSATFSRADLTIALVITPQPGEDDPFALSFDPDVMAERLAPLADSLYVPAQDASFRLQNGEIRIVTEERSGREVDYGTTIENVLAVVDSGDDESSLEFRTLDPEYTSDDRMDIELDDLLGQSSTSYVNSSEPRRNNVERASEIENGWIVPPDGVFSYAEVMGLVDEDNGFVTGYGIVADPSGGVTTAPVIGGGICQVSTTIFQAAYWSGLPIVERWAHPYWLQGYGQAPYGMEGLDAMVNIEPGWSLDLKFQNTTGNWIALVVVADGSDVRAEILGIDPGWEIDVASPKITDVVRPDPKMIYTDSPELPRGEELQVETAQEGFTSTLTRVVRDADGQVVDEYVIESTYAASRNTTLRGTGGEGSE